MSTTSSFIAGLLTGAAAVLAVVLFRSASRAAMRGSRKLLAAGGLVAAGVALAGAMSLAIDFHHGAVGSPDEPVASDAPAPEMASPPGMSTASGTPSSSGMPSASMMSQILAMPRGTRTQMAEPMDQAAADLAARLQSKGGTAADWTLLAQAYDFLGRPEDAQRARARAAEVGAVQRSR